MVSNEKVLTVGDGLITMDPAVKGPLRYVTHFERKVGGAELNFAIACSRLSLDVTWISRLGKDEFGRHIYNFARGEGIDVSHVRFVDGCPTSLNFKQINEDGSGKTFYYRDNSPIVKLTVKDITEELFQDISLVHITGVFMSIHPQTRNIVYKILELAAKKEVIVSFDPNIRLKMWTIQEARDAFAKVFPYVDILLAGLDEMELILGDSSEESLEVFANKYNIAELVIKDGANGSKLFKENRWLYQNAFKVNAVDTVGAGDGFDAGYVYSFLHQKSDSEKLRFANAVGALVTTVKGDNEGLPYLEEVEALLENKKIIER